MSPFGIFMDGFAVGEIEIHFPYGRLGRSGVAAVDANAIWCAAAGR